MLLRGAFLLTVALAASGCSGGGGGSTPVGQPSHPIPPTSVQSAGNAKISARAKGSHGAYTIVVRAADRTSGVPIDAAKVSIYGEMSSPHLMVLMTRPLHEVSRGTYQGPYQFVMPGTWTANIVLRTKTGDASTAALRIAVAR